MIEIKTQHPFILRGEPKDNLIRHWAEDENGQRYKILQVETQIIYSDAVDVYPCRYTYETTEIPFEERREPLQEDIEEEIEEE